MLLAAAGQLGQDLEYVVTEDERKADPAPPLDMKAASQAHAVAAQSTYGVPPVLLSPTLCGL